MKKVIILGGLWLGVVCGLALIALALYTGCMTFAILGGYILGGPTALLVVRKQEQDFTKSLSPSGRKLWGKPFLSCE